MLPVAVTEKTTMLPVTLVWLTGWVVIVGGIPCERMVLLPESAT